MSTSPEHNPEEIITGEIVPDAIHTEHVAWFSSRGIPMDWAADEVDARSIDQGAPAQWPVSLEWQAKSSAGLRFDYPSITGGKGWSQVRPDTPSTDDSGRVRKYIGNSGEATGERLILTKTMSERAMSGGYERLLIVEGTGQTLATSYIYRDQDAVLVVGVPGCYGWSAAGICTPEVHRVASKASEVTVIFDADVTTNPAVHDAGTRLSGVVEGATGDRPRFLRLPVSGTQGVDDWLAATFTSGDGTLDDAEARRALNNLIASKTASKALTVTRPKGKEIARVARATLATINREALAVTIPTMEGAPPQVLAEFAPYIERSYRLNSRLDEERQTEIYHDIAIDTPIGTLRVQEWPNQQLHRVEDWLEAAGYAHAVWVNADGNAAKIVAAMKRDAHDHGVGTGTLNPETGWTMTEDGRAIWIESHGGITASGYERGEARALLADPNGRRIDLSCLEGATEAQRVAALRAMVTSREMFTDQAWYILSMGSNAWSLGGAIPEGMTYLVGSSGAGKSARQGALARLYGKKYTPEKILGKNEKVGSDIAFGLHNALSVPDDLAGDDGQATDEAKMTEILDTLARRSGGSDGEGANGRVVKALRAGKWEQGEADPAVVGFAASGEQMPTGLRYSSRTRILAIKVKGDGWHVGGVDRFGDWKTLDKSGTLRLANATLISSIAERIDAAGSFGAWEEALGELLEGAVKKISADPRSEIIKGGERHRILRVPAGRLAGWRILVEAAVRAEAITVEEAQQALDDAFDVTVKTMVTNYHDHLEGREAAIGGARLLDLLREAVASGRWVIDSFGSAQPGQQVLGTYRGDGETKEETHVCVLGKTVAEATGLTRAKALAALREIAEPDSSGTYTRGLAWGGGKGSVKAYWIPVEKWNDLASEGAA